MLIQDAENVFANLCQLLLDLLAVLLDEGDLGLIALGLLLLLNGGDNTPRRPASTDDVLVRYRQQIPLLHGQLLV